MPDYDVTIGDKTYTVSSDKPLSDVQAYQYAKMQADSAPKAPPKPAAPQGRTTGQKASWLGRLATDVLGENLGAIAGANPALAIQNAQEYARNSIANALPASMKSVADAIRPKAPLITGQQAAQGVQTKATRIADKAGFTKAQTPTEKVIYSGAKGVANALIPTPGGKLRAGEAAIQAAGGALSGVGAEAANQMGLPGWAQTLIGLGGGIAVPASLSAVKNVGGNLVSHLKGVSSGEEQAARQLQGAAKDSINPNALKDTIANILTRKPPIGKTAPTLAEAGRNTGLAAFQRSKAGNPVLEQMAGNAQQRSKVASGVFGQGDTEAVPNLAATETRRRQFAETRAGEKISPLVDTEVSGTNARKRYAGQYEQAKKRTAAAYDKPTLTEGVDIPVNAKAIYDKFKASADDWYGAAGGKAPGQVQDTVHDLFTELGNATGDTLSTRVIANVDRRLADFAGRKKVSGARSEAAFAERLRRQLKAETDPYIPANVKADLDAARAARRDQSLRFERGKLGAALKGDRYEPTGPGITPDIELPGKLVKPSAAGGGIVGQLRSAVGDAPTEAIVREQFRRIVEQGKASKLLGSDYDEIIKQFPTLRSDIESLRAATQATEAFGNTQLGKLANNDVDMRAHVTSLLGKADKTDFINLRDQVLQSGNKDAIAGLRRTLAQYVEKAGQTTILDKSGNMVPKPAHQAISEVLKHTEGTNLLTSKQRNVLEKLQTEMEGARFAETGGTYGGEHRQRSPVLPLDTAQKRISWNIIYQWAQNNKVVDELVQKAFRDPEFAAGLLQRKIPDRIKRWQRTVGRSAYGAGRNLSVQQPQPETVQ